MQPEEYDKLDDKEKLGAEKPEGHATSKSFPSNGPLHPSGTGLAENSAIDSSSPKTTSRTNNDTASGGGVRTVLRMRRTYIIGSVIFGLVAALLALFFAFLAPFKLSFMKENVDSKRMARLIYIMDERSDRFLVTMIKAEVAGEKDGKNRYFMAKGWYDTPHPFTQWYRDIRTDQFFDDLEKKKGVRFIRESDGIAKDRLVVLNVRGQDINFRNIDIDNFDQTVEFERLVEGRFEDNKSGRRALNAAIKENTKSWQVIKRYNLRKWGYERLGITKWRFFEGTREKVDNAVKDRWTKAVARPILTGRFGKCIFGRPDDCPKTSNPNDERNSFANDSPDPKLEGDLDESTDEYRTQPDPPDPEKKAAGKIAKKFASKAVPVINAVDGLETARQIEYLLGDDQDERGLVKLIAVMRAAEYASAYFTFGTVTDHLKEGEKVTSEEVNSVMGMTEGIEKSDSYDEIAGPKQASIFGNRAYAQEAKPDDFDEVTDMMMVNSDGNNASKISRVYNNTFGAVIGPIADAYEKALDFPIIGDILNGLINAVNSVIGGLVSAGTWVFGQITGTSPEELLGGLIKIMYEFLGGAPLCGAEEGGGRLMNCVDGGGSVVAEGLMQTMGGAPISDSQANYLNEKARIARYENEQLKNPWQKIISLDNPQSLTSKIVMNTPTSYNSLFERGNSLVASLAPQGLSGTIAALPSFATRVFSGASFAQQNDDNLYGVKRYGFSESDLDSEPFDSQSNQQCTEEINKFNEAMKKGEDPPASICLLDEAVSNSMTCIYSDSEECAQVGDMTAETESETGIISGDLPDGSVKDLAKDILNNSKITLSPNARTDITSTSQTGGPIDKRLLQLILGAANAGIELNIGTMKTGHTPGSLHEDGQAMDLVGVGGDIVTSYDVPFTGDLKKLYDFMIQNNKDGEFGVPNGNILEYVRGKGVNDAFIDKGTGPHLHFGVN